jgi:hypothetical protein
MAKLKLSAIPDGRPVKLTVALPGAVHRDLVAYAEVFAVRESSPQSWCRRCLHGSCRPIEHRPRTACKERGGLNGGRTSDVWRVLSVGCRYARGDVAGLADVDVTAANSKTLVQKYLGAMRRI